jgi:type IV pilus assembly protein PilO
MEQFQEQWNTLPLSVKFLLVVVIWGLMGGLYYFMMYEDQLNSYKRLVRSFKEVRKQRDKLQTIQFNIERWKSEIARLDGELEKAKLLLPTKSYIPKLLRRLDDLARKSGLDINQFNPKRPKRRGFYTEVPFQVKMQGTFFELMVFLNKVSNLQRIVTMDSLDVSNSVFKNQKMSLTARFRLVTYRYRGTKKKKKRRRRRRR